MGYLALFAVGVTKFLLGKNKNEQIAMDWRKNAVQVFRQEFDHVGCNSDAQSLALMQRSYSEYEYFASGRQNVFYAEANLSLRKRHCLFTTLLFDLTSQTEDLVQFNIPLNLPKNMPLEFLVCRRKDLKGRVSKLTNPGNFIKNPNSKHFKLSEAEASSKNSLMVLAEHDEISNNLIDQEVGLVLAKYGSLINLIHVTDLKQYNNFPLFLRAELQLTSESEEAQYTLLGLMLRLADNVAAYRMSQTVVQKCEKSRKQQKQEEQMQVKQA
mmetsp:Transcript_8631/g.14602  ORF Transcript_8631/g.14602 Transcript_8631/m.14602 type:complete len:269 (+) Transcript_8631:380-1186(+)